MLILIWLTRTHLERRMVINVCSLQGQTCPAGKNRTNVAGGGAYYVTTPHQGWLKPQIDPPCPIHMPMLMMSLSENGACASYLVCLDVFYLEQ